MDKETVRRQIQQQIDALFAPLARPDLAEDARAAIVADNRRLEALLRDLDLDDVGDFVRKVDAAADALEVTARQHDIDAVEAAARGVRAIEADLRQQHRLPATPSPASMRSMAAAVAPVATVAAVAAGAAVAVAAVAQMVRTSGATRFDALRDEYDDLFRRCATQTSRRNDVDRMATRIRDNRARYEAVGDPLRIPWQFIGVTHAMESSLSFARHLHNGDPLTARTVQVPAGRPKTGSPPFTWEESATDALVFDKLDRNTDWSIPRMLFLLERFNGFGYRRFGIPTPYLWSFSTLYDKGKFVADGRFDRDAVSQQCGAGLLLKQLA